LLLAALQNLRGFIAPGPALHRVEVPGLAVPIAAVRIAVPGLLQIAADIIGVEQIVAAVRMREPAHTGSGTEIEPQTHLAIVEVEPLLRLGLGGKAATEHEQQKGNPFHGMRGGLGR
jgi:hypothetical protein